MNHSSRWEKGTWQSTCFLPMAIKSQLKIILGLLNSGSEYQISALDHYKKEKKKRA